MVVGRDYMLKKPRGLSSPKLFFDTRVVPLAVNLAGSLEVSLARASSRTGIRPALICAGGATLALLAVRRFWRSSREASGQI